MVTAADIAERTGGLGLLSRAGEILNGHKRLWVDGGYTVVEFAREVARYRPEAVVEVVERTFGWLMHHRLRPLVGRSLPFDGNIWAGEYSVSPNSFSSSRRHFLAIFVIPPI